MDAFRARRWVVAVIAGLLAATFAPAAGWAAPRVRADALSMTSFSPTSGPVGTAVTISGTGFAKGDIVQFNGTAASKATATDGGTKLHTTVPPLATSGPITVSDPTTGQTASLPGTAFQVTTGLAAFPKHVWAGGALEIAGSGLSPDRDEQVFLGKTPLANVVIDQHGNFDLGTEVPFDEHSGRIGVYVLDPNLGRILTVLFVLGAWPMYRHDAAHTGFDTYETSISVYNAGTMKQHWTKAPVNSNFNYGMLPSVTAGLVYEGDNPHSGVYCGDVYAFTTDGKNNPWFSATGCGAQLGPAPAEDSGIVYYVFSWVDHDFVAARNATTGAVVWDVNVPSDNNLAESAPVVANGRLFFGSGDGNLYALATTNGSTAWTFPTGGPVNSSPAFANGIVYVGSDSGSLFAIKAATGKKVWSASFGGPVKSSPAVSGGVVYVGADDGTVAAFDAATGAPVWSRTFKSRLFRTAPAIANNELYIAGDKGTNGTVFALEASNGMTDWSFASGSGATDPAVANGVLYDAFASSNVVYALDASSGFPVWNTNVATSPLAPIVANGQVYVEGANGIWAFGL